MQENPSYYSIITADVRYDKRLKANEKLLYSEITALTNKNGYCSATNRYFAELYTVATGTVSGWIQDLVKYGYITKEVKRDENQQVVYRHIFLRGVPDKSMGGVPDKKEGAPHKNIKENNTSLNNTSINNKHSAPASAAPSVHQLKDEFETVWKQYPNKKGKKEAFNHYKAWRKASKKHTNEYLLDRLKKYLAYCQQNSWYHPMNGSTWFNGRFDDELDVDKPKPANRYDQEGYYDDTDILIHHGTKQSEDMEQQIDDDELPF